MLGATACERAERATSGETPGSAERGCRIAVGRKSEETSLPRPYRDREQRYF